MIFLHCLEQKMGMDGWMDIWIMDGRIMMMMTTMTTTTTMTTMTTDFVHCFSSVTAKQSAL